MFRYIFGGPTVDRDIPMAEEEAVAQALNPELNRLSHTLFRRPEKFKIGEDFDLFVKKSELYFEAVELKHGAIA